MRIYFLSSIPAALYVGGAYFGKVSSFERFAEISLSDNLPIRFEAEGMLPLPFFLSDRLPLAPPSGVDVYRLPTGLALYAHGFIPADQMLSVIAQKRNGELLATVVKQGGISLGIESPNGFFNASLPPSFCICEVFFVGNLILLKSPTQVAVFTSFARLLLMENYQELSIEDAGFSLTVPLSDHYGRVAECHYTVQEGNIQQDGYTLKQSSDTPKDGLIAYGFFESVRIGADFTDFLSADLPLSQDGAKEFLGDFVHVLPCEQPTECLLVYKKAERLFDVRKFTVTVHEGKITDIVG